MEKVLVTQCQLPVDLVTLSKTIRVSSGHSLQSMMTGVVTKQQVTDKIYIHAHALILPER